MQVGMASLLRSIAEWPSRSGLRRPELPIDKAIVVVSLLLLVALTVIVRVLPSRYGIYVSEFDPYFQLYATRVIVESVERSGLSGLSSFFTHHIGLTWQPEGVDMGVRYYPGVPYTGAVVYMVLRALGLDVTIEAVAIWLPVAMAVLAVLGVYLMGREVAGEFGGLVAGLLASISPAFILRSNMGWYDTECVGIPAFIYSIYFYVKSLQAESDRKKVAYGLLAGLAAGYMGASWGAATYLVVLLSIYPIAAVILGCEAKGIEKTQVPAITAALVILNAVPRNRLAYATGAVALLAYASIAASLLAGRVRLNAERWQAAAMGIVSSCLALVVCLSVVPAALGERHLSVVNPFYRAKAVFVKTVQEQAMVNVGAFVYNYNVMIPFLVFGLWLLARNYRRPLQLFLLITALTAMYASSTFARLFALSALVVAVVAAHGLREVFSRVVSSAAEAAARRRYARAEQARTLAFAVAVVALMMFSYTGYVIGARAGNVPPTIACASVQVADTIDDWLEALAWIRDNVPEDAVIAAWWDYGYWISFVAGRRTLADNGTLNLTRISLLAEMFLSNESRALEILSRLNADYVLIFIGTVRYSLGGQTYYTLLGVGEDSKFIQMARIIGVDESKFIYPADVRSRERKPMYKDAFWQTFLGKLIPYKYVSTQVVGGRLVDLYVYSPKYPENDPTAPITLVFRSSNEKIGEVLIYKINWDVIRGSS